LVPQTPPNPPHSPPATNDPDLSILHRADGSVVIRSRSAIPGFLAPDPRDRHRLGVKIARITLDEQTIPLDHHALTEGRHDVEPDGRWTNGRAIIPALLSAGNEVNVEIGASLAYPVAPTTKKKLSSGARQ
jgi:hypothetical protein